MNRDNLIDGKGFVMRVVRLNTLFSLPALAIVLGCAWALLDLPPELWKGLFAGIAIYTVVASPVSFLLQRRTTTAIAEWLDADAPDEDTTQRAFVAMLALPLRTAHLATTNWLAPTLLISIGMKLSYADLWTSWDFCVLLVGGIAAGFGVSTLTGLFLKGGEFARVRDALARAVGDPEERRRLSPRMSIRVKLPSMLAGACLVPVMFAVLVALDRGEATLDAFAQIWTQQALADLPVDADAARIAAVQETLASRAMPIPVKLIALDAAEPVLRSEVAEQMAGAISPRDSGSGDAVRARSIYSWRKFPDGTVWIAALSASDLYALGTVSPWLLVALVTSSLLFTVILAWCVARDIAMPVAILRAAAERLASGDLRPADTFESEDELGELARSFDGMVDALRTTIAGVAASADGLEARASALGPVCRTLSVATVEQEQGTRRASESMEQINGQVSGIAQSSSALNESIEESSSSILELGASGEELNETASLLSSKVDEVSSSIEQMVRSVKQVSENTEALANAADETSASMEEMATSLREVDASAAEAMRLSERVVERAESGRIKVRETIAGMEAIREATDTAEEVIRTLGARAVEIGAIVDVIDDVADETNLLALNAAIIAAQAGDHGRAFSVVAEEIKDLAERVLASTKEIGGLIRSVQEEAGKATAAIERGSKSVASGVDLSAEAGMALEEITAASQDSGTRITGIVSSLREQAKAAGHVVDLMERVRGGVDVIREATAEQNRGNVVVFQGAVTMREVALQVRGTTEEQARGSVRIRESVEGVREAVERINSALQEQSQACSAAADFLEEVRGRGATHEEATRTVEGVSRELLAQAEELRSEVRRFRM
ncbi:MAG TPA: methyl-accepting chemotaxis protein [Myxococcota bacterium]|nr:methyl-accepting chemotaxis protein [Myxococcota bacterium]